MKNSVCRRLFFVSVVTIFFSQQVFSQTLSRNDSVIIIDHSEKLMTEFEKVLNLISGNTPESDKISASKLTYDINAGERQIFTDGDARIDNDLKAAHYRIKPKINFDKPVSAYYSDFDDVFKTAETKVARFFNIICDTIYFIGEQVHSTVYFNSLYDADNKNNYCIVKKRAEMVCKKLGDNKWSVLCSQISINWFDKDSTVNSFDGMMNMKLYKRNAVADSLPLLFCNYKWKTNLSIYDNTQLNQLNDELRENDSLYFGSYYVSAHAGYSKLALKLDSCDYLLKRIANCNSLKITEEKKQKLDIVPLISAYLKANNHRDFKAAKKALDDAYDLMPDDAELSRLRKRLEKRTSDIKNMEARLRQKETNFIRFVDSLLVNDSANADYHYYRGVYLETTFMHKDAITNFDKALEQEPNFTEARKLRVKALIVYEEYFKALSDIEKLLEDEPVNDTLFAERGECYFKLNDLAGAVQAYTEAIKYNSHDSIYFYRRGTFYFAMENQTALASDDLRKAISMGLKKEDAFYKLYEMYMKKEKPDSAIIFLRGAKETGLTVAHKKLLESLSLTYLTKGKEYERQKFMPEAARNFRISANLNYENHEAWYRYAGIVLDTYNDYKTTIGIMDSALKYSPSANIYLFRRARAKVLDKQQTNAIADYNKVLLSPALTLPERAEAYEGLGDSWVGNDNTKSENFYNNSLKSFQTTGVLMKLAKLYYSGGKYKEAINTLIELIDKNDALDSAFFLRAQCYELLPEPDYRSAIRDYQYTLKLKPAFYNANLRCGICYKIRKDYENAMDCFRRELEIQRTCIPVHIEIADCRYLQKKFKEAYDSFYSAIMLRDNAVKENKTLCKKYIYCCMANSLNVIQAGEYIAYALTTYPDDKYFIYLNAEFCYLSHRTDEAIKFFREAFISKAVTLEQTKDDEIFLNIKSDNAIIKQLWKDGFR